MIPKKLTLKGIYSYQEQQVIDFEYLTKAQLFGVFGSVGSGKSTLLEAISFALYGQTERLGKHDDLKYNMMNLKSSELFIEFDFENFDGKSYRFTVSGKRNSKRFTDVNTFKRGAYLKQNQEWIPLANSSAEDILGLSYSNFRRTIIIPQGKFQEFLQLGNTERTRMLKDIFNLSKYEYELQVKSLGAKNNQKKEHLLGKLTNYELVSKTILKEKEEELKGLEKSFESSKTELDLLVKNERDQSKVKSQFESLKTKKEELISHKEKEQTILEKEQTLISYEQVNAKFKEKLNRNKEIQLEKTALEKEEKTSLEKIKAFEQSKSQLEKQTKTIQTDLALVPNLELELNDLALILKIKTKEKENEEKAERIKNGSLKIKEIENILKHENTILNQHKETRTHLLNKQNKGNLEEFSELKSWFTKYAFLKKEEQKTLQELKDLQTPRANVEKTFLKKIGADTNSKLDFLVLKELTKDKESDKLKAEKTLETQRAKINTYNVKKELEKLSHAVKDGEPCPLCGALEHPEILNVTSIDQHLKIEEEKLVEIEKTIKKCNSELEMIRFFENDLKTHLTQVSKIETNLKDVQNSLKTEENNFKWKQYSIKDEEKVSKDFEAFLIQEKQIKELASNIEKSNERISKETTNKEKFSKAIAEIELAFNALKTEVKTYQKQLTRLTVNDFLDANSITKELKLKTKFINDTQAKSELLAKQTIAVNQELAVENERLNSNSKRLEITVKLLTESSKVIEDLLNESNYKTIEAVKAILALELNVTILKKEITDYKIKLETLKAVIKEQELALNGKTFDLENYTLLIEKINEKSLAFKRLEKQKINLETTFSKLKNDLIEKIKLEKELDKINLRADNIATLRSLFKQSGFVNYISSVYLENLCSEANVRFSQLTRHQLKLEIGSKNEFLIRDYLNEGKVRSVKTLSGGQMFQASLSLALALAESIQQQNKANQNFFFLDEGFGSQDKESLQVVFESLKALRKENRVVGVISHVEELQQEISTYLHIVNHNEVGSKIARSWGD